MTTMRSVEPLTGIDRLFVWLFPFFGGGEPQPGERGIDARGWEYTWEPGHGWQLILDQQPPMAHPQAEADPELEMEPW